MRGPLQRIWKWSKEYRHDAQVVWQLLLLFVLCHVSGSGSQATMCFAWGALGCIRPGLNTVELATMTCSMTCSVIFCHVLLLLLLLPLQVLFSDHSTITDATGLPSLDAFLRPCKVCLLTACGDLSSCESVAPSNQACACLSACLHVYCATHSVGALVFTGLLHAS